MWVTPSSISTYDWIPRVSGALEPVLGDCGDSNGMDERNQVEVESDKMETLLEVTVH